MSLKDDLENALDALETGLAINRGHAKALRARLARAEVVDREPTVLIYRMHDASWDVLGDGAQYPSACQGWRITASQAKALAYSLLRAAGEEVK